MGPLPSTDRSHSLKKIPNPKTNFKILKTLTSSLTIPTPALCSLSPRTPSSDSLSAAMEYRPPATAESTRLAFGDQRAGTSHGDGESNADEEEEAEVEKLEEEVMDMAQKLSSYRSTFPDQLRSGFAAVLAAQRPQFPDLDRDSEPGSASGIDHDADSHGETSEGAISAAEDQETAKRIKLLKEKISSNMSSMPLVLKRMNECISRIDKLNSRSEIIHPAFKRKKS